MSSRFSNVMVFAIVALCAMASVAVAQTSGTETSGQSGTGIPGAGIGMGTPGSGMGPGTPDQPNDQSRQEITGDISPGSTGTGISILGSPTTRPGLGVDRPGTGITEQPGAMSPGTEPTGS